MNPCLKRRTTRNWPVVWSARQQGEHFRILDPPSLPVKPYSPNRLKLSVIGLFVGLVLGARKRRGRDD